MWLCESSRDWIKYHASRRLESFGLSVGRRERRRSRGCFELSWIEAPWESHQVTSSCLDREAMAIQSWFHWRRPTHPTLLGAWVQTSVWVCPYRWTQPTQLSAARAASTCDSQGVHSASLSRLDCRPNTSHQPWRARLVAFARSPGTWDTRQLCELARLSGLLPDSSEGQFWHKFNDPLWSWLPVKGFG